MGCFKFAVEPPATPHDPRSTALQDRSTAVTRLCVKTFLQRMAQAKARIWLICSKLSQQQTLNPPPHAGTALQARSNGAAPACVGAARMAGSSVDRLSYSDWLRPRPESSLFAPTSLFNERWM